MIKRHKEKNGDKHIDMRTKTIKEIKKRDGEKI